MLPLVEEGFKSINAEVKIEAFRAWKQLILNFSTDNSMYIIQPNNTSFLNWHYKFPEEKNFLKWYVYLQLQKQIIKISTDILWILRIFSLLTYNSCLTLLTIRFVFCTRFSLNGIFGCCYCFYKLTKLYQCIMQNNRFYFHIFFSSSILVNFDGKGDCLNTQILKII